MPASGERRRFGLEGRRWARRPAPVGAPGAAGVGLALATTLALLAAAEPIGETDRVRWQGTMRNIAVYRPATAGSGAPLLLALGNPGRSARYALKSWRELADSEGLVVAALSSEKPESWRAPQDGPGLLRVVVRHVQSRYATDPRRVYLFGSAGGAAFALGLAALQPEYFAAVATFGGAAPPQIVPGTERLARAVPVRIFHSKRTPQFDVDALEAAAAELRRAGADVEVRRLDASPDFERRGHKAAGKIWEALGPHALAEGPRYHQSRFDR